jgi:hypothetical protein
MPFGNSAVIDNFDRANEGPPPSASWTRGVLQLGASTGIQVDTNRIRRGSVVATYRQGGYWNAATFGPDCEVFCTLPIIPTADSGGVWLFARLTTIGSGTTDGYALGVERISGAFNDWRIYRIDNGAATLLGGTMYQTVSAGDSVGLEVIGTQLTAYYKAAGGSWMALGTQTDSTYATAGNLGVEILLTAERVDDFSGGTVVGGTFDFAAPSKLVVPMGLQRFRKPSLFTFPLYPEVPGPVFQSIDIGFASETNAAQTLGFIKTILKTLGVASEADAAQALNVDKILSLGVASEIDAAQAITEFKSKALGVATEADAAQALNVDKIKVLIPATETDEAQVLSISTGGPPIEMTLTPATESDVAQALTEFKRVTIIPSLEADAAVGLTKAKLLTLGFALESDESQPLVFTKTIYKSLTPAQEFDVAVPLTIEGAEVVVVYKYRGPIVIGRF